MFRSSRNALQAAPICYLMTKRVRGSWHTDLTMPRIIYSLKFDLGRTPNGELTQLIAPLDPGGRSPHCRPCMPKRRVIDLWVSLTPSGPARTSSH